MAENYGNEDVKRFELREENVTCCLEYICCGYTKLTMGEEEVELKNSAFMGICNGKKRGPYGEMGTVDSVNCCCFVGFRVDSLQAEGQSQCTGLGCEGTRVGEIVEELKRRQALRGDRAKVRMAETTLATVKELNEKVDLILEHLNLEAPKKPETAEMTR